MTLTEVQYLIIATDEADDAMLQATRRRANLWEYQDSRQLSAFPNDDRRNGHSSTAGVSFSALPNDTPGKSRGE